jgi:hypothetical protein
MWHVARVKVAHGRWPFVHDGPRILPSASAQMIHVRGPRGRGRPVDADAERTWALSEGAMYIWSIIISDQVVVADSTLYSAPSNRRDMDLDAERT